jgi:hypothetical protein
MKFAVDVLGSDRLHERKKLLRTASRIIFTSHFSSGDVQRAEQVDCAMPDVVAAPISAASAVVPSATSGMAQGGR